MKVRELIDQLQQIDNQDLAVCIAEWNEWCRIPAEAQTVEIVPGPYLIEGVAEVEDSFVCIDINQ